jgi:hypothetical protein
MSSDEPKPVILDAKAFLDWVKTKPRDELFNYVNTERCAVAQFLKTQHPRSGVNAGSKFALVWDVCGNVTNRYNFPDAVVRAAKRLTVKRRGRYTYGELADSLSEELLAA